MNWYEEDVEKVEAIFPTLTYQPSMIFYGSSSIRLWDSLYEDFKKYQPVNLGFGGSTLEACVHFFERIMEPYREAKYLVVYAGDNDLGDGKQPEEVLFYFRQLRVAIQKFFPDIQVFFISIKSSIARWEINEKIKATNQLIQQSIDQEPEKIDFVDVYDSMIDEHGTPIPSLFVEDGLHMSTEGYAIWKEILQAHFAVNIDNKVM